MARSLPGELLVITEHPAAVTARQIADALKEPCFVNDQHIAIHARFGIAEMPSTCEHLVALHECARLAMFDAEHTAPRDIVAYGEALRTRHARRAAVIRSIERALDATRLGPSEVLGVRYEPRYDAVSRRVVGLRARPAWLQPDISEPELRDALRDGGLRSRVGFWILGEAAREAMTWPTPLPVAVEIACTHLAAASGESRIHEVLAMSHLDPSRLELELTDPPEHDDDLDRAAGVASRLHATGVRIVLAGIDDRCAIRVVRRLPLAAIRTDHETLQRAPGLLAVLTSMARPLGIAISITGVDNAIALASSRGANDIAGAAVTTHAASSEIAATVVAAEPVHDEEHLLQ